MSHFYLAGQRGVARRGCLLLATALVPCLTSCLVLVEDRVQLPIVEGNLDHGTRIAADVGLFVDEENRSYEFVGGPTTFTASARLAYVPLGPALERFSYAAYSGLFDKVTLIRSLRDMDRFDLVITPRIERYEWSAGADAAVTCVLELDILVQGGGDVLLRDRYEAQASEGAGGIATAHGSAAARALESAVLRNVSDILASRQIAEVVEAGGVDVAGSGADADSEAVSSAAGEGARPFEREQDDIPSSGSAAAPPRRPAAPLGEGEAPPAAELQGGLPSSVKQRWAVVVGISDYLDSRVPDLRYAADDALAFHDWLVDPRGGAYSPHCVQLLLNEDATLERIREALFLWLKEPIEEDLVTIYFAGHGSPDGSDRPENLYFLPHDVDYDRIGVTGFPMWDVQTALERYVRARRVIVIADACHSAGIGADFGSSTRDIVVKPRINSTVHDLAEVGSGVVVLTAADEDQRSREGRDWGDGHGVFTWFLLRGLRGAADYTGDGRVTLGELIPYVSESVRREVRDQTPRVSGQFDPAITIAGR